MSGSRSGGMSGSRCGRMRSIFLSAALLAIVAAAPADPDWPCVQRLVPKLTAATLWPGPPPTGDWHDDKDVVTLVDDVGARRGPLDAAVAKLERFVATKPGAETRAEVFAGLVDRANVERGHAIERLKDVSRRLRALTEATGKVTTELNSLPADAPAAQRSEVVNRRALMIREYEEIVRTLRYACEIPVDYEARLGRYAEVLRP